jgi:hypothetical protein
MSFQNNIYTDKNTTHSYFSLYEKIMRPMKESAKNIFEIGIGDFQEKNGGSLILWRDYFTNANIFGVDILPESSVLDELINDPKVKLYCNTDAYNNLFVKNNLENIKFDLILDDGPHTLESQEKCIELYSKLLCEKGILIIEDVQDIKWIEKLKDKTPENLKKYIKTYDLRENKNRYDDIVFTIDKLNY